MQNAEWNSKGKGKRWSKKREIEQFSEFACVSRLSLFPPQRPIPNAFPMPDIFDDWPDIPVPPPPALFEPRLRERMNRALTAEQFVDGVVRGMGSALIEFTAGLVGGALWSIERRRADPIPAAKRQPPVTNT